MIIDNVPPHVAIYVEKAEPEIGQYVLVNRAG